MASHLLRLATVALMLVAHSFGALLALVAITSLGERSAKTLEMLFATQVAGEQRAVYQALFRSVANAGYAVGAGIAAIGLAIGTVDAYRALILFDALSFVAAALLVRLTSPVPGSPPTPHPLTSRRRAPTPGATAATCSSSCWTSP